MSFQYLMIRNKGLAPIEGLTLFGVSTSRAHAELIGEFGSGSKKAVALMLRNNVRPILYVGSLRMEFDSIPISVDDGIDVTEYNRVVVKYSGSQEGRSRTGTEKLGFTTQDGVNDWCDLAMALRELVSNALDRQSREKQPLPEISIVSEPVAKRGYTSWFIPVNETVLKFYVEIPQRFLHFKGNLEAKVLPKADRNPSGGKTAVIYKKGVFVREWDEDETPSLFDYNLGSELALDESRNVDNYAIRSAVSRALAEAPVEVLVAVMQALVDGRPCWEHTLDSYQLDARYESEATVERRSKNWKEAWNTVAGEGIVITGPQRHVVEMVEGKGYSTVVVENQTWRAAFSKYGIVTDEKVLSKAEGEGKAEGEPHADHVAAVDAVWDLLVKHQMTLGRPKPSVRGFQSVMEGQRTTRGYWKGGDVVFLDYTLVPGKSVDLMKVAIEEVAHHVTQATDNSRDFQDFAFRLAALVAFG